jgi:hypothetical protein
MPAKKKTPSRKKTSKRHLSGSGSIVAKISKLAKKIRKPGEKWTNAIKRASKEI